jgi:tryptophan-rich sensory protein
MTTAGLPTVQPVNLPRLLATIGACQAAGAVGTLVTRPALQDWYPALNKPPFNPPASIFGPVWTVLYAMMGVALDRVSRQQGMPAEVRLAQAVFGIQLALNALWSLLFFGARSPLAALVEIVLLWVAIVATIVAFARVSKLAAALLLPYLLWVTFAIVLNAEIWRRNR